MGVTRPSKDTYFHAYASYPWIFMIHEYDATHIPGNTRTLRIKALKSQLRDPPVRGAGYEPTVTRWPLVLK